MVKEYQKILETFDGVDPDFPELVMGDRKSDGKTNIRVDKRTNSSNFKDDGEDLDV